MVTWRRIVYGTVLAACVFICPDGRAGEARDVRELKVAAFERRGVSVGLGGEFPGARGWMSYTNDIARLNFDFTKGGNYVTMRAGRVADGAKKFSGLFRCKCDGAGKINLRLRGVDAKGDFYVNFGTSISPDEVWREVSFDLARLVWRRGKSTNAADRAAVKWPIDNLEISCEPLPRKLAGFLEVKDLRLATEAEAAKQVDWTFSLRAPTGVDSLVYPGGSFVLPYALKSLRVDGGEMSARLVRAVVTDDTGGTVCDIPLSDAEGALSLDGDALGGRFGAFRAGVFGVDAAGREREFGATWFARLAGKSKPVAWCGTGVHGWGRSGRYRMIAAAGIGMVRTGSRWEQWEKERGVYACPDGFKETLDEMHGLGIQMNALIYSRENRFYGEPLTDDMDCVWATPDRVKHGWRTLDEDAFCNWVRHFVTHEGSGADFYEIWNEPWNFYFGRFYSYSKTTGRHHDDETWIRKFASFSRKVADTIREVRPEAHVGVCSEDGDGSGLERMLRAGIARKDDCVTFHPYIHLDDPRPERFGFFFADDGARIKAAQAANGGSTRLRITEVGWTTYSLDENGKSEHWFVGGYPSVTYAEQANYLIRAYLLARSFGVESMMQYDFSDDGRRRNYTEHNFGMVFQNLTPKPSYAAVAFMTLLLGEATPLGRNFGSDNKTHRIVGFDLPDGRRAYAAWAVEEPVEIAIPEYFDGKAFTVRNLYGTPVKAAPKDGLKLTEDPVYIIEETDGTNKPGAPAGDHPPKEAK